MVREIDQKQTKRSMAFELWLKAPMPLQAHAKQL